MIVWVVQAYTPYEGKDIICVKQSCPSEEELRELLKKSDYKHHESVFADPYEVLL